MKNKVNGNKGYRKAVGLALGLSLGLLTLTGCSSKKEVVPETETEAETIPTVIIDDVGPAAFEAEEEKYADGPQVFEEVEMDESEFGPWMEDVDSEIFEEIPEIASEELSTEIQIAPGEQKLTDFGHTGMNRVDDALALTALGVHMDAPEGARDALYYTEKDLIGIVDFYYEDQPYSFYGAKGITYDGLFAPDVELTEDMTIKINGIEVTLYTDGKRDMAAYWTKEEASYGLYTGTDKGADLIKEVCQKLM